MCVSLYISRISGSSDPLHLATAASTVAASGRRRRQNSFPPLNIFVRQRSDNCHYEDYTNFHFGSRSTKAGLRYSGTAVQQMP
jgi:hypothetical protein